MLLTFTQLSCDDHMELLPPYGLVREDFWKTKEDVEAVLMAAYQSFAAQNRNLFLHGELRADLLAGKSNQPTNERIIMENNIYPDNNFCNWRDFYVIINYCNEVIKNAPVVKNIDNTFTDFRLRSILAEAYFLRSLSYFYLVRIYNEVPLVLQPSEDDGVDFFPLKSTEEEVLNQIVADLNANWAYAPSGGFSTIAENKGRASKGAYDALLADIALWRFQYEEALNHIERIENEGEYLLMPSARWFEIYYPGNSLESIFEFQFDGNLGQPNSMYNLTQRNSNQYGPSMRAIQMFGREYTAELVRGEDVTIDKIGDDNYIIWKYLGQAPDGQTQRSGGATTSANFIVYRLADILLMKAEALSQLGRFDEALMIINKIRDRANVVAISPSFTTTAFEDAILQERALELAYEGKRWFDLLRMGRRNDFERKGRLIEIIVSNAPSTQRRILSTRLNNPLGWYLPVHSGEIDRNRNLKQNPFYDF
jgi:starch-binding outer membrane protein, SusD/RagB family